MWYMFGTNPPANEKLYRVWLLLKAPGHSCWTLSFLPQSFWSVYGWEETQQTSNYPPPFSGSFHHFSSLAHHSFTLGHFTHSYICSRLHIIFLLSSSLLAPVPASANFMPGQSLENHQGHWKQSDESSLSQKQTWVLHNQPFTFLSVTIKKRKMEIIFRHGSRFLFRISQFKIIYLNTALCKCAFCGPQLFSTWATVKSYWH